MSEQVVNFVDVTIRHRKYLLFLVNWSDFQNDLQQQLDRHSEDFGRALGRQAAWVRPYDHKVANAQVLAKPWPAELKKRMENEQYPFLLVIGRDFDSFDPVRDRSAIVWFSKYEENPADVWKPLDAIVRKINADDDLFVYFETLRDRARRSKWIKGFQDVLGYLDLKFPLLPGFVSIHVGAILKDAAGKLDG